MLRELWVNWEMGQLSGRAPVKSGGQFGSFFFSFFFFFFWGGGGGLVFSVPFGDLVKGTLGQLGVGIAQW